MKTGWIFPKTAGGSYDGFNDSGIETFRGNPFESLAREVLQNSLDAKKPGASLVTVEFDVIKLPQIPDHERFSEIVAACVKESQGDEKANAFMKKAAKILAGKDIQCLQITDSGTTGLQGGPNDPKGQWFAITKARGLGAKKSDTAGGSYGIGKNAPFAVSDLRTVFYSTRYMDGANAVEKAQGKSILMSQPSGDGNYTSGTGFYGAIENCQPLEGRDIPEFLKQREDGTRILIAGFNGGGDWQKRIIAAVISNFFYAIDQDMLQVLIQGEDGSPDIIDRDELQKFFGNDEIRKYDGVEDAKIYYEISKEKDNERDMQLNHLGFSTLWTRVAREDEILPKKVALLRKTGMLITDEQKGLKRWPGVPDFAAVCICKGDDGNKLLRRMENPQHDAFEPDRLDDDKKLGVRALDGLSKKIREIVKGFAMPLASKTVSLDELSEYLPDQNPEESLPGEGDERDLEGAPIYQPKRIKIKQPDVLTDIDHDGDDNGGEGTENGDGKGGGESDGGDGGERRKTTRVKIEKVRVLHTADNGQKKTVIFTPLESGKINLSLHIAGDSFYERLPIAEVHNGGTLTSAGASTVAVTVQARIRGSLTVTLQEPIKEAILVVATKEQEESE